MHYISIAFCKNIGGIFEYEQLIRMESSFRILSHFGKSITLIGISDCSYFLLYMFLFLYDSVILMVPLIYFVLFEELNAHKFGLKYKINFPSHVGITVL